MSAKTLLNASGLPITPAAPTPTSSPIVMPDMRPFAPASSMPSELMAVVQSLARCKPGETIEDALKKLSKRGLEVMDLHVAVRWCHNGNRGEKNPGVHVSATQIVERLGYKPAVKSITQALNMGFIRHERGKGYL